MKKRLKTYAGKVIVFFFGIILSVLFVEILLRLQIIVPHDLNNDGWWKWRWHTEKKTFDGNFTEFPDQFDSLLGWVPKKIIRL